MLDRRRAKYVLPLALAGGAAALSAAYLSWYSQCGSIQPKLYFKPGSAFSKRVLETVESLLQPYHPPPFLGNPHVQNMLGVARALTNLYGFHRQHLACPDGGLVALDWYRGCDSSPDFAPDAPVVLVLHGITGGSHEGYCKWMCAAAAERGWRACVLLYRGCSGLPLTTAKGYCASFTDDVHLAVGAIKQRFPAAPLLGVGYSLGGLLLTKYLAEADSGKGGWEGDSGMAAAVMVSNPFCMASASDRMAVPFTTPWLYNLLIAHRLGAYCSRHKSLQPDAPHIDWTQVSEAWLLDHFDESLICKVFGYPNPEAYHADADSMGRIPSIRTPSLFLVSEDDPFLGALPTEQCKANPHTMLAVTRKGGHVSYLQGLWPLGPAWMEQVVTEFLGSMLCESEPEVAEASCEPVTPSRVNMAAAESDTCSTERTPGGSASDRLWHYQRRTDLRGATPSPARLPRSSSITPPVSSEVLEFARLSPAKHSSGGGVEDAGRGQRNLAEAMSGALIKQ